MVRGSTVHCPLTTDPYLNRTRPPGLRGRCSRTNRRTGLQCVGQELNLHSVSRVGYSHLGSPMPSRRILPVARVGVEPTISHQGLSLVALPVCVPCCRASPMGFEPMISTVTGWRALQAAPRGRMSVAQVGVEPTASLGLSKGGLPIAYRAKTFHSSSGGWSRTSISGFRNRCPTG